MSGLPMQIAQYNINDGKLDEKKKILKYSIVLKISNNIHNVAVLDEAEFIQEWHEDKKSMKSITKLKYKLSSYALAPTVRKKFIEEERKMFAQDQEILDLKQLKNTLEAYS